VFNARHIRHPSKTTLQNLIDMYGNGYVQELGPTTLSTQRIITSSLEVLEDGKAYQFVCAESRREVSGWVNYYVIASVKREIKFYVSNILSMRSIVHEISMKFPETHSFQYMDGPSFVPYNDLVDVVPFISSVGMINIRSQAGTVNAVYIDEWRVIMLLMIKFWETRAHQFCVVFADGCAKEYYY